ncbi:MAG: ABC transporter permease [Acidobacteria bacterium]|nr:MAG: ABC transporter permease [Acidobacteriota bacterium]
MKWVPIFGRRKQLEWELDEELRAHLAIAVRERIEKGEAPAEAEANARREFGNMALVKDVTRDQWGWRWPETLVQDVRYGLRQLRRNPGFTIVAVVTLALGIGCATAIFAAFNATVLHPLPFPHEQNLVRIKATAVRMALSWMDMSLPDALALRRQSTIFDSLGYYGGRQPMNLTGASLYAHITSFSVSPEIFRVLGVRPAMGRWLRREESRPGDNAEMVISHSLWVQNFGSNPDVIGKTVRLNNKPYRVVGVMPLRFAFPDPFVQAWLPEVVTAEAANDHSLYGTPVIGRLKRGISPDQAQAELDTLARWLASENPTTDEGLKLKLVRMEDEVASPVSRMFWVLLGAVGLVLLIACANVGNLFLARNAARERELAVRISLGAGRTRMVSLVMAEALLLALTGGSLGLAVSVWEIDGLRALASGSVHRMADAHVDLCVLGFALAASAMTAILFGLAPALRSARLDLNASLRGDLNSRPVGRAGRPASVQNILVAGQFALVVLLLIGAGLMQRSLSSLMNVPLGFDPSHLAGMCFAIPEGKSSDVDLLAFQHEVLEQVRAIPGVKSAEFGSNIPLMGPVGTMFLTEQPDRGWMRSPLMEENSVGPGYFKVLGLSIIRGRTFLPSDSEGHPCVAILNRLGARSVWGDQNPLGRMIYRPNIIDRNLKNCQIVGEVSDARFIKLDEPPGPEIYFSRLQLPELTPVLLVRSKNNPLVEANVILNRVDNIPGAQRVMFAYSIDQLIERSALQPRFRTVLLSIFAGLTLVIAAIGIYGVMAYFVSQRTKEIGIRTALGAEKSDVLGMVVGQGLKLALIGVAVGIAGALALTRFLSSLLYGVTPTDPLTFIAVSLVLIAVALAACYIPARHAAKVDPMVALRYE